MNKPSTVPQLSLKIIDGHRVHVERGFTFYNRPTDWADPTAVVVGVVWHEGSYTLFVVENNMDTKARFEKWVSVQDNFGGNPVVEYLKF